MDFLDPKKQRAHLIRLIAGYVLISVAVLISTFILLYQAYGFGFGKDGEVIQSGLVFVSSQPDRAKLYLNTKLYKSATNTKLQLPEGKYKIELQRQDYNSWERMITVEGGSVQHIDYPKLFPTKLITTNLKSYTEAPGFATQSPDRRWLLVQQTASPLGFDVYDLSDPKKIAANTDSIVLPDTIVSDARSGKHTWKLVEWSTDNRHILAQHTYTASSGAEASEYIMIDRAQPASSLNLTKTLGITTTKQLALRDKKFDQYYIFDPAAKTVGTTTADAAGKITPLLDNVLAYKPYGADMVLYVTDTDIPAAKDSVSPQVNPNSPDAATDKPLAPGRVLSVLRDGNQTYKIRDHSSGGPFLIDMAEYSNDWYVAVGSGTDNKVYIYKNPQRIRRASQTSNLVPQRILRLSAPNHIAFSSNTEFIMAENGTAFADYDAEYDKGYNFTAASPIDQPPVSATWMDGQRITYVSGGKLAVFDYDNTNSHILVPASPNYLPFFDRNYQTVYTLTPATGEAGARGMVLTGTSLLTPADQ